MQMHESAGNGGGGPAGSYVHDLNMFLVQNAARAGVQHLNAMLHGSGRLSPFTPADSTPTRV